MSWDCQMGVQKGKKSDKLDKNKFKPVEEDGPYVASEYDWDTY